MAVLRGAGGRPPDGAGSLHVIVELDAFSGAPNPRWTVDDATAAAFVAAIAGCAPAAPAARPSRLGYRGLAAYDDDGTTERFYVGDARVFTASPGSSPRRDHGRAIERALLATGRGTIAPDLLAAVVASLDRSD